MVPKINTKAINYTILNYTKQLFFNPYAAELFVFIFHHLKLELLTQFPND